jgi:hypothetical protein
LIESASTTLDEVFFSTNPAAPGQPGGILAGLTPLNPSNAGQASMSEDIGQIAEALGPVMGSGTALLIASPAQAAVLKTVAYDPGTVLTSAALPPKTIVGVVPEGIVSAIGAPRIEMASNAALQFNDTPAQDGSQVARTTSLFQSDSVALPMILQPCTWARRSDFAVSYMSGVNW